MPEALPVTDVRLVAASFALRRTGLVGWLSFQYGDLVLDSVALRITDTGRWALSFPARRTRQGRDHPYIRPVTDNARVELEHRVLSALGLEAAAK